MTQFKKTLIITTIFLFALRCSSDSEVLASFEGGNVTRKELREFYQIRGAEINEKNASIANQSNILEQMALQKMVHKDFLESKKVTKEFIDKLVSLTKGQMLITLYKQEFEKDALKNNPMDLITMQMVILRNPDGEPVAKERADELTQKLNSANSDEEIEKLVLEKTADNNRKPIKGMIEPFCVNCGSNPYADILEEPLKNDDGKFYSTQADGNTYILRIFKRKKIHEKVLTTYLEENFSRFEEMAKEYKNANQDPQNQSLADFYLKGSAKQKAESYSDHLSKQFRNGLWQKEMERIKSNSKIKVENVPMLESPETIQLSEFPDDRVLAELTNGEKITIGSFREDFKELSSILGKDGETKPKEEMWDMLNFFYNIYLSSLIMQEEPAVAPILKSDIYETSEKFLEYSLVWSLFMQEIADEKIEVSESDMKETYEAGKMFAYSKPDPKNNQKRIPLPYSQVKEKIQSEMENQMRKSIFDSKIKTLKTEYNLKIATESLTDGKI